MAIGGILVECKTSIRNGMRQVSTVISENVTELITSNFHRCLLKQSKLSDIILNHCTFSPFTGKISMQNNEIPRLIGGGGCGSRSFHSANESAVVKSELSRASNRKKAANTASQKSDVKQVQEDLHKVISVADDDIDNGKAYVMDRIVPLLNSFSVIANRVHHNDLLKVMMKAINLILRVGAKSGTSGGDSNEDDDGGFDGLYWTEIDKKEMETCLTNITDRIKAKQNQDGLLMHVFCVGLIRDMLKTSKTTFDVIKNCVELGVPLFGLIRNQDPTILLVLALKAHKAMLEANTKSAMGSMVKFQIQALNFAAQASSGEKTKEISARLQLLFAYHKAFSELLVNSKKEASWEVQVYALMAINECLKGLAENSNEADLKGGNVADQVKVLLEDKTTGLFALCASRTSLNMVSLVEDLMDSFLWNHKTIRFISLEILINLYVFLSKNGRIIESTRQRVVEIIYERWLLETAASIRPVFLNETILAAIEEFIAKKSSSTESAQKEIDAKVAHAANEESAAIKSIREKRQMRQGIDAKNHEIEDELKVMSDTMVSVTETPDGMQKLVQMRQLEIWKQGVLARRARGESQKDDALLDAIDQFVGLNLLRVDPFALVGSSEEQERNQEQQLAIQGDSADSVVVDGMEFLKNQFLIGETAMCVILGGGGSGKSLLLKTFEIELLKGGVSSTNQKSGGNSNGLIVPILVRMAEIKASEDGSIDLEGYLRKQAIFKEQRIDVGVLKASNSAKVLLLDAIDEYVGAAFNIWNTFKLAEWVNTKVLVTSRYEIASEFKEILSVPEGLHVVGMRAAGFSRQQLTELAKKTLKKPEIIREFEGIVGNSDEIQRMLALPINAATFMKTMVILVGQTAGNGGSGGMSSDNSMSQLSDSLELQELFFRSAFERDSLQYARASKEQVMRQAYVNSYFAAYQQLAVALYVANALTVPLKEVSGKLQVSSELKKVLSAKELKEYWDEFSNSVYENTEVVAVHNGEIGFVHGSLMEFFVARAMFEEVMLLQQQQQNNVKKSWSEMSKEEVLASSVALNSRYLMDAKKRTRGGAAILLNFSKMLRRIVLSSSFNRQLLHGKQNNNNDDESNVIPGVVIQAIHVSKSNRLGKAVDTMASNVLSALCATRASLTGLDVSHCSFSKAYLYNYKGDADFTGADLSEAMIAGCTADLSRSLTEFAQRGEACLLWQGDSSYSFSACYCDSKAKDGSIQVLTAGSSSLNRFVVSKAVNNSAQASSVLLEKSLRLYTGKVIGVHAFDERIIVGQSRNIVLVDSKSFKELQVFQAHSLEITSLDFDQNSRVLMTAAADNSVRFWKLNASNSQLKGIIIGKQQHEGVASIHTKRINHVRVSSHLKVFASASDDKTVSIWNSHTGAHAFKISLSSPARAIAFQEKSDILVTCNQSFNGLQVWRVFADKAEVVIKTISNAIPFCNQLRFSRDGSVLAAVYSSNKIGLFQFSEVHTKVADSGSFESINIIESHENGAVEGIYFDEKKYLVSIGSDRACVVTDLEKVKQNSDGNANAADYARIASHQHSIVSVTASCFEDAFIASVSREQLILWKKVGDSVKAYSQVKELRYSRVTCAKFVNASGKSGSNRGNVLAVGVKSGEGDNAMESMIELIAADSGKVLDKYSLKTQQSVSGIVFSPTSLLFGVIVAGSFVEIRKFNDAGMMSKCSQLRIEDDDVQTAAFISDSLLAIGFKSKVEVHKIDVSGESNDNNSNLVIESEVVKTIACGSVVTSIVCTANGKAMIVASGDGLGRVFGVANNYRVACTFKAEGVASQLTLSSDSKLLAGVGEKDGVIRVWATESNFEVIAKIQFGVKKGDQQQSSEESRNPVISFSKMHARHLVVASEGNVAVADIESSYELVPELQGHSAAVMHVAYALNGNYLVSVTSDTTVNAWVFDRWGGCTLLASINVASSAKVSKLVIKGVAFIGDSKRIAVACSDGVCRVYAIVQVKIVLEQSLKSSDVSEICGVSSVTAKNCFVLVTGHQQGKINLYKSQAVSGNSEKSNFVEGAVYDEQAAAADGKNKQSDVRGVTCGFVSSHGITLIAVGYQSGEVAVLTYTGEGNKLNRGARLTAGDDASMVTGLKFTQDCRLLCVSYFSRDVNVFASSGGDSNWQGFGLHQKIGGFGKEVSSVDVLENSLLAVSLYNSDCEIYERDAESDLFSLRSRIYAHPGSVTYYAVFNPAVNGKLATCARDASCKIWDFEQATKVVARVEEAMLPHSKEIEQIVFDQYRRNDCRLIAMLDKEGVCSLWDGNVPGKQLIGEHAVIQNVCAVGIREKSVFVAEDRSVVEYRWEYDGTDSKKKAMNVVSENRASLGVKPKKGSEGINTIRVAKDRTVLVELSNFSLAVIDGNTMQVRKVIDDVKSFAIDFEEVGSRQAEDQKQFVYVLRQKSLRVDVISLGSLEVVSSLVLENVSGTAANNAVVTSIVVSDDNKYLATILAEKAEKRDGDSREFSVRLYEISGGQIKAGGVVGRVNSKVRVQYPKLNDGVLVNVLGLKVITKGNGSIDISVSDVNISGKDWTARDHLKSGTYVEFVNHSVALYSKNQPRNEITL